MRSVIISALLCHTILFSQAQQKTTLGDTSLLQPVELVALRAGEKTPVAKTNLSKNDILRFNTGQDLPFILNQTASVIVHSDAGNGVGYTGIRIRGTDASRINITINGIPYNDAESQGTFFVNIPDLASSAGSIQIQRGVGTSTNGAGSFGGTINIGTNDIVTKPSLELNNSGGSFHSFKNTLMLHSGLLAKHITVDARLSHIRSDGYIDRAASRLRSFYTSAAYITGNHSIRLNIFTGKEKTYQAWYGINEQTLDTNRTYNPAGTEKPGEPYENETDNYTQTHYQLFYNAKFSSQTKANVALFLTRGKGYYEQYKAGAELGDYGLPGYDDGTNIITETDLVRRLWLDNYFYGTVFSLQYQKNKTGIIAGGGWNRYDGSHFGKIHWARIQPAVPNNHTWYDLPAVKTDLSGYIKWTQKLSEHWQTFADLQIRSVGYRINGFRNNPSLTISNDYLFINPKAGITYSKNKTQVYFSYAHAGKEPNRDDFEAGVASSPRAEMLHDFEAGIERKSKRGDWSVSLYHMLYRNQLVLTGKINDVGAYTRTNIPVSYRSGIELQGRHNFNKWITVNGNVSFSSNKIRNYTEYIDDYDNGGQQTNFYKKTDISFSPAITGGASLNIFPFRQAEINIIGKYVGRQFLDNTSNRNRSLHDYYVQDIRLGYDVKLKNIKSIQLFLLASNVFSEKYEANGYSFSYIYGGKNTTENYYFPMATINGMAGLNIRL